jgi:hypothetical protein
MKTIIITGLVCGALSASAAVPTAFYRALWQVEASGKEGNVIGDNGRSLGPYQIGKAYWQDSRIPGTYGMVTNEAYARRVVSSYLSRYAPAAVAIGDLETLARIHNGGPAGASKAATLPYWRKVQAAMPLSVEPSKKGTK